VAVGLAAGQLGPYELIREAGHGGMSVVYEARDTRIGRRVAVKVVTVPQHLSAGQREALLARLRREARAIARLSHPNIVTIYDVGEEGNQHFLVMEYLDGQTLRRRLDQGPLPPAEASRILDQIADALDAVHAEGVIHRDIKPSNVMLLPDGRAKLMDFGVARQADDTLVTQAGMMVGSPVYMAPELINGEEAGVASDLWSLSVLLYEMLAGKPPFPGQTIPVVMYRVMHDAIAPLPGVPPAVQKVLARALDKDPARRYGSAHALAADLRAALAPRQPRASALLPPSPHKRAFAPWGLAALMLAALAGVTLLHPRTPPPRTAALPKPQLRMKITPTTTPHAATPPTVRVASIRQERPPHPQRHRRHRPPAPPASIREVATAAQARPAHTARSTRRPRVMRRPRAAAVTAFGEPAPYRMRRARRLALLPPEPRRSLRRYHYTPAEDSRAPTTGTRSVETGLLGTWHGTHTRNPATLTVTRARPGGFDGVMTVRTHEALVRVAVTGRVSQGRVTMRETRVLSQSRPRAWDLGSESGQIGSGGQMSGTGTDIKGRYGRWTFSH